MGPRFLRDYLKWCLVVLIIFVLVFGVPVALCLAWVLRGGG